MKLKALLAFITTFVFLLTSAAFPVPSNATSTAFSNYEKAVDLKILGLLANTPDSFELERAPTRIEGAVMLVRLLGKENEALKNTYTHPFTDVPAWADRYIGYMYRHHLTKGISDTRFGSADLLSAKQYVTFVLRSIGYEDKTDFDYDHALDTALQTGLLGETEAAALKTRTFIRNDLVGISYNALNAKMKKSSETLLDKLIHTDQAIYKPAARLLGLYTSDEKSEFTGVTSYSPAATQYGSVVKNSEDLFKILRKALYSSETSLRMDVRSYSGSITEDFEDAFNRARDAVTGITGIKDFLSSWKYRSESQTFTLTIQYRYTKSETARLRENANLALNKARDIVARLISKNMSDYDKEKKLHDYLVRNTTYDYQNYLKGTIPDESYNEFGCLVLGVAVCEGYSMAMKLLCDLSSLECMIVSGESRNGNRWESHAWNIVKIDGASYHLDVTSDDPVTNSSVNIPAYYYFNLPDSEMTRTSRWNTADYPACTGMANNYYYRNSMIADSRYAFDQAVQKALEQRSSMIEIKVTDYSKDRYSNLSEILFKSKSVSKYSYTVHEELGVIRIYSIQYS